MRPVAFPSFPRPAWRASLWAAALLAAAGAARSVEARPPPPTSPAPLKDEKKKREVPAEAERTLGAAAAAFRIEDAAAVCALLPEGKDARLYLRLKGLKEGAYTKAQATEILEKQFFAKRQVVSLAPSDECSGCGEWSISRSYRLVYRLGEKDKDVDGSLVIGVEKQQVGADAYAWFLISLADG